MLNKANQINCMFYVMVYISSGITKHHSNLRFETILLLNLANTCKARGFSTNTIVEDKLIR